MRDNLTTAGKGQVRIGYLDSARALAALSVIVWHYFTAFYPYDQASFIRDSPFHLCWYGDRDVTFFFIHSGFILTYTNRQFQQGFTIAEYLGFLIRRAFRIFPLYLFVLLASHLVAVSIYPLSAGDHLTAHFHEYWVRRKDWLDVAREALLVIRIPANSVERYMPQDWTLTVELIVSSMIPFLTLLMKRRKWLGILAVPVLAKVPGLTTYVLEFGIGVILFHTMEQTGEYWRRMGVFARAGVVLLSVSLMSCFFHFSGYLSNSHLLFGLTADRLIVAAGCALAIPVILHSSTVQRILSAPILERLGESCYGLYLFHFLLLIAFGDYALGGLLALGLPMPAAKLLLLAILLVVTAALSISFHFILEQPLNRWGKRLGRAVAGVDFTNRISLHK